MTSIFSMTLAEMDRRIDERCVEMKQDARKMRYERYMDSDTWRDLRSLKIDLASHRCEECGSPNDLQVHHLTYDRFGGDELLTDLQVLCKPCHNQAHGRTF